MKKLDGGTHHYRLSNGRTKMAIGFYEKFTAHDWSASPNTFPSPEVLPLISLFFSFHLRS
jgi:hypothetical protein